MSKLRQYQAKVIDEVRNFLIAGLLRVVLYAPTGSGKTECAIEFCKRAVAKGKRVLFLANRIELIHQAWRRFERSGIYAGMLQADNTRGLDRPVVIGSIHTLAKRGCPDFDLLLIDEAHAASGSKAYVKLLSAHRNKPVVGLTATPFARGLGRDVDGLGKLFQTIAKAATIRELIDLGFLVDVDIYGPSEPDLHGVKIVAGDYHEGQLADAVDKPQLVGDIVSHWHRLAAGKQTVCFATSIAHSKHIVEQFHSTGVAAEHIDCYTSDDDRAEILRRFNGGETRVLSNVAVLAEGWDAPRCEVMILARPTRSLIRYIQMAGRILRPYEGKQRALLLDHSGTVKRLGFPTDDLPLELDDGKRRTKKREEKPAAKLPKACPSCSYMMPPRTRVCPGCGAERHPEPRISHEHGNLVQLKRASADKRQIYAELLGYAEMKGFKPGWAAWKCKELFGTWPRTKSGVDKQAPSPDTIRLIRYMNIRRVKAEEKRAA